MGGISEKIRHLRNQNGWSQEELARRVGVSLSTIYRWEKRGDKPYPLAQRQLDKIFRLYIVDD
ncbi:multiprotein-bridging factor 1 family protein [Chloroflexota bacterium]